MAVVSGSTSMGMSKPMMGETSEASPLKHYSGLRPSLGSLQVALTKARGSISFSPC